MLTAKQRTIIEKYIPQFRKDKAALTIYPFRYETIEKWDEVDFNTLNIIALEGQILEPIKTIRFKGRAITRFSVMTQNQLVNCVMYNRPYFKNVYQEQNVSIIGKFNDKHELVISTLNQKPIEENIGIFPIYPLKKGINQYQMRTIMKKVLKENKENIDSMIPIHLIEKYNLLSTPEMLIQLHQPTSYDLLHQALRSMKYSEALRYQMALQLQKALDKDKVKHIRKINYNLIENRINQLPYELTRDQNQSLKEILEDLGQPQVMRRLLLGDVGSGKTVVALLASLAMIDAGYQVAFLCPTEVLAQQHYQSALSFFDQVGFLSGSMSQTLKDIEISKLRSGQTQLIIGTHALFSDPVEFKNLGFVIIDEQHRFGVNQRQKMIDKGEEVDTLMLSATPIPRTLASTLYSHLKISTIESMPQGRKPVITKLIQENTISSIFDEMISFIQSGQQVYIICPSISAESEIKVRDVQSITQNLKKALKDKVRIGSIHSKMNSQQISETLDDFRNKELDILVSTTIVEVGVHVPDANMMIIYDGDRFGLSQLHQLRGRIGRDQQQGYCYVLTQSQNQESLDRLETFVSTTDGFVLAQMDLMMRGSGDLLGLRQSGFPQFTHLDLVADLKILETAQKDAQNLVDNPSKTDTIFIEQIKRVQMTLLNQVSV